MSLGLNDVHGTGGAGVGRGSGCSRTVGCGTQIGFVVLREHGEAQQNVFGGIKMVVPRRTVWSAPILPRLYSWRADQRSVAVIAADDLAQESPRITS